MPFDLRAKKHFFSLIVYKGSDYIVRGQTEDGNYRLISGTSIGSIQYQPNQDANGNYYNIGQYDENDEQDKRYDGQDWYYNEGTVDNPKWGVYYKHKYTETDEGIFPLKVWYKQDVGYSDQKYNTINRSCFFMSYYEYFRLVLN